MRAMLQILKLGSMLTLAITLAGCEPKVAEHGRSDLLVKAGNIIPQQTTESDVQRMLGTPPTTSQFGEKTWYYFGSRNEAVGMFAPETVEQEVLRITFANGVVDKLEHYNKAQSKDIAFSSRETPSSGQKLGFFEQLMGNIGRFNKKQDAMSSGGRSSGTLPGG